MGCCRVEVVWPYHQVISPRGTWTPHSTHIGSNELMARLRPETIRACSISTIVVRTLYIVLKNTGNTGPVSVPTSEPASPAPTVATATTEPATQGVSAPGPRSRTSLYCIPFTGTFRVSSVLVGGTLRPSYRNHPTSMSDDTFGPQHHSSATPS